MKKLLFLPAALLVTFFISCGDEDSITYTITTDDVELTEGNETNTQTATFELSQAAKSDLIISAEVSGGDAMAGEDFTAITAQSITIASGAASFSIDIEILGDLFRELDEEIVLTFTSENADFMAGEATIVLVNDDESNFNLGELVIPEGGYETPTTYEGYNLVWADEFDQETLNEDNWSYDNGNGCPNLCGWGNQELQFYMDENLTMQDGLMIIEAKSQTVGGNEYTSSKIISKGKQSFQYGRIDIRANMPYGQGLWPALWMLGDNIDEVGWPACGEIDIMEMVGGDNGEDATTFGTVHWDNDGGYAKFGSTYQIPEGRLNDNFHVYSIIWDEELITWYIDDVQYHAIDITPDALSEFRQPFYFIFNVAVGGTLAGDPTLRTVLPQYMIVDYVRVFQPE